MLHGEPMQKTIVKTGSSSILAKAIHNLLEAEQADTGSPKPYL